MACDDVPVKWRRTFAVTTYLYLRAGEANALSWEDIDLDHGAVHVHQSIDRRTGNLSTTKTEAARRVPIDAALLPLLEAMLGESGGVGRVLATAATDRKLSRQLRRCLQLAGVTRAELFADDASARSTRKPMTFHDLRATGITWCAVRGDAPLTIMQRAGHRSFSTTQGYIREAENLRAGFGHPFPTLPTTLGSTAPGAVYTAEPGVYTESAKGEREVPAPSPHVTVVSASLPSGVSSPGFGFVTQSTTGALKNRAPEWRRRESKPICEISNSDASAYYCTEKQRACITLLAKVANAEKPIPEQIEAIVDQIRAAALSGDLEDARIAWKALEDLLFEPPVCAAQG